MASIYTYIPLYVTFKALRWAHKICLCLPYDSRNKQRFFSIYSNNQLVFLMEKQRFHFSLEKNFKVLVLYKHNSLCLSLIHTRYFLYLFPYVSSSVILLLFLFYYLNFIFLSFLFISLVSVIINLPLFLPPFSYVFFVLSFFFLHCFIFFSFLPFLYYQLFLLFFPSTSPVSSQAHSLQASVCW